MLHRYLSLLVFVSLLNSYGPLAYIIYLFPFQAPLPSAMASLCFAVLAFLLMPFLLPGAAGSGTSIGVAAPEGLLLPSSKCPSPVAKSRVSTIGHHCE